MDAVRYRAIRALFDAVVERPPSERAAFLSDQCTDADIRASVESLLASHESAGQFLSQPAVAVAAPPPDVDPFVGHTLASFRITGVLGAGGMGTVYRAEQGHPRRDVALKIIRAGWSTHGLRQRFAHEAAALGRLRHPGIAQIFEAGSAVGPDGRETPFFAMELVDGLPLAAYVARNRPALRDRLLIFALICDAAHHAHQKGIVHRDLKPANILVEDVSDGVRTPAPSGTVSAAPGAQPKILDFGIARLTDSDLAVTTIHTSPGQVVGTLAYMSPEQVRGEIDRVDTRSDVYALGVVLYELLTGRLPYSVKGKPMPEAARLIADEEPTALGTIDRSLRGDIETIVHKAMAKEPERRYASAAELAADIRRHLADLPIVASPATAGYKLRKFARRNKALVGGVAMTILVLVAGVVGTGIGLVRARAATRLAEKKAGEAQIELLTAQRTVDFLTSVLSSADPAVSRGRDVTVREVMDDAAALLDIQLVDEPEVALRSRLALCRTYLSLAQIEKARDQAARACELAEKVAGTESLSYARALSAKAAVTRATRKQPESVDESRNAYALFARLLPPDDPQIAKAKLAVADSLMVAWKHEEAAVLLREAKAALDRAGDPAAVQCTTMLVSILSRRSAAGSSEDKHPEALAMLDESVTAARTRGHSAELDLALILAARAELRWRTRNLDGSESDWRESIAIRERIYPELHPKIIANYAALSVNLRFQKKAEESCRLLSPLVERLRAAGKGNDAVFASLASELALAHSLQSRHEEALSLRREVLPIFERMNNKIMLSVSLTEMGETLLSLQRPAEAEQQLRRALEASGGLSKPNISTPTLARILGESMHAQAKYTEAAEWFAKAQELAPTIGANAETMLAIMVQRYTSLAAAGDGPGADSVYSQAFEHARVSGLGVPARVERK